MWTEWKLPDGMLHMSTGFISNIYLGKEHTDIFEERGYWIKIIKKRDVSNLTKAVKMQNLK